MTYDTDNRILQRRLRTKATRNYGARVGETIAGNLGRGQGGRFAASGSGAGQKPRQPRKTAAQRMAERRRTRDQTLQAAGMTASEAAALTALTKGAQLTELRAAGLIKQGLAEVGADGKIRATPTGRRAARVAESGDLEKVQEAISTGIDREARRQERDRRRTEARQRRETRNRPRTERPEARESAPRTDQGSGSERNDRLPKRRRNGIRSGVRDMTRLGRKETLSVFKAHGRYRWVLVSSCAYRDRDQEIVSTKALEGAVALADKTGYRGPLRWWHIRGVDLGDCDFQAIHGRFLIESGTFRDERFGAAVARKAHLLQGSIGFTHPRNEPDARGVFHHIAIFERSLTPLGRAANPLTRLVVKEDSSMDNIKREALKQLLSDDALLDQLLAQVEQTDKSALAAGVDFKSDDPKPEEAEAEKAATEEDDLGDEEPLLTAKEIAMIGDHVAERLSGMLDLPSQLQQMADRFSGMMGEQSKKKDDAIAAVREQSDKRVAAVERRLKALEGDQPRAFHRASESDATVANEETVKELGGPGADNANPFADMAQFLFGQQQQR